MFCWAFVSSSIALLYRDLWKCVLVDVLVSDTAILLMDLFLRVSSDGIVALESEITDSVSEVDNSLVTMPEFINTPINPEN